MEQKGGTAVDNRTWERMPLLTHKGQLTRPSWAVEDVFEYNKERIRRPGRRKEWEFYQVSNRRFTFQVTYGHVAYAGTVGATLVDFETGERYTSGPMKLFPGDSLDLDFSPGQPHNLKYEDAGLFLSIGFDGYERHIVCRSQRFDAELVAHEDGDAMVIATPFQRKYQFYYNYKKNFLDLAGHVRMHKLEYPLDQDTFLLLDSGRGVWPYRHQWVWGNGSQEIQGHILGINIGWGFGQPGAATENMLFWDGRAQKLGRVWDDCDRENWKRPWRFYSDDGRFHMEFTPFFDNFTEKNFFLVKTRCHQVYGALSGTAVLDDGTCVEVEGMHFFCEYADNRW